MINILYTRISQFIKTSIPKANVIIHYLESLFTSPLLHLNQHI